MPIFSHEFWCIMFHSEPLFFYLILCTSVKMYSYFGNMDIRLFIIIRFYKFEDLSVYKIKVYSLKIVWIIYMNCSELVSD